MSIGLGELILVLIIAFVVVGPEDLPKITKALAKLIKKTRYLYCDVKNSIGIDDDIKQIKKEVSCISNLPIGDGDIKIIQNDLNSIQQEIDRIRN